MGLFSSNKNRDRLEGEVILASNLIKNVMQEHGATEIKLVNDLDEDESLMFSQPDGLRFKMKVNGNIMTFRFSRFALIQDELMCKGQIVDGDSFSEESDPWESLSGLLSANVILDSVHIMDLARWMEENFDICEVCSAEGPADSKQDSQVDEFEICEDSVEFGTFSDTYIDTIKSNWDREDAEDKLSLLVDDFGIYGIEKIGLWSKDFEPECSYSPEDKDLFVKAYGNVDYFFDLYVAGSLDRVFAVGVENDSIYFYFTNSGDKKTHKVLALDVWESPEKYAICFDDVVKAAFKAMEFNSKEGIPTEKWAVPHVPQVNPYTYGYATAEEIELYNDLITKMNAMQGFIRHEKPEEEETINEEVDSTDEEDTDDDDLWWDPDDDEGDVDNADSEVETVEVDNYDESEDSDDFSSIFEDDEEDQEDGTAESIQELIQRYSGEEDLKRAFANLGDEVTELNLTALDVSNATSMESMCIDGKFTKVDLSNLKAGKVETMLMMFQDCENLAEVDFRDFEAPSVTDFSCTFAGCANLKQVDLSSLYPKSVTSTLQMFGDCSSLETIDLSNFNFDDETYPDLMFMGCDNLKTIYLKGCSQETIDKIKNGLEDDCISGVEIITE
ncbi:MAG: BspA family leucine-rich repeat surface protein [Muribaculum sp.]|nr:BspA family leucine-rich repeat surface protein [Muribaculum sp.]